MIKPNGFSLIEILVVIGILSLLITGAFFIGLPEYNRYIVSAEREYLIDALLESRTRTFTDGMAFTVNLSSTGYCIQNSSGLCVEPFHDLPSNLALTSITLATSTEIIISSSDSEMGDTTQSEIIIDQYGFIDGR